MHRYENLPWRMVYSQPWKRALEKHVERSHQKALDHGVPSNVKLLEHIQGLTNRILLSQQHAEPTRLFCSCQRVLSPGQASAHRTLHGHDSP
ncbi:hypothetical protein TNCV_443161 [Trichonephila clavipes]|nr:hypothetical protein TNCV_443161 [Trichonephila clavipes]